MRAAGGMHIGLRFGCEPRAVSFAGSAEKSAAVRKIPQLPIGGFFAAAVTALPTSALRESKSNGFFR